MDPYRELRHRSSEIRWAQRAFFLLVVVDVGLAFLLFGGPA